MQKPLKKIALILLLTGLLFSSFARDRKLTWMAIGDSITYLNGKPAEPKNRITKSYLERVEKLSYITYTNYGHGGLIVRPVILRLLHPRIPEIETSI